MTPRVKNVLRHNNKRSWGPGDISFALIGGMAFGSGLLMLLSPELMRGSALVFLYSITGPRVWGYVWLMVSLVPLFAVVHPTVAARERVFITLLPMGALWTAGLTAPLFTEQSTSLWLPIVFGLVTVLGYVSYALVALDSIYYRPVVRSRNSNTVQIIGYDVDTRKSNLRTAQNKE